ncbi:hypothetical protein FGG08_006139 [Glutinoglossum americanum]|uniref:PUM-HD domain-containing protein n=1 Tax=Glutinoglossum americanum TaxID=1670608 RepID=A0A9P8HYY7_9PEZI|nr:hypothetical protein FGG08_006139 [Glutinoglossum americanum]
MAFSNGLGDRFEDLRFRNSQSQRDESPFPTYPTPLRSNGNRVNTTNQPNDSRMTLQRRFTTDSTKQPTMSPIGQSPNRNAEPLDLSSSLEKKRIEYELLKERRRKFEADMQLMDLQQRKEEQEISQIAEALNRASRSSGHQSEPTTPPEHRDSGFPSLFSHSNRFSTSSIVTPPGIFNRLGRSGSQLITPPSELAQSQGTGSKMPSKSVPGSRRNSDENENESTPEQNPIGHRSAAANSMPANGLGYRPRQDLADLTSQLSLGQINTTGFLFGDDDTDKPAAKKQGNSATSPDVKSYLQMNATDDKFPILVRRDDYPGLLSASSAALDLALSHKSKDTDLPSNGWPSFARHRPAQHSLPMNPFIYESPQTNGSPSASLPQSGISNNGSPGNIRRYDRNSMELTFSPLGENSKPATAVTSPSSAQQTPPKLQSSYSTNDIPTMKGSNGMNAATHAQQHFHNHNASLGRIPINGVNNRHSRELTGVDLALGAREPQANNLQSFQSGLQGGAQPFGPPLSSAVAVPGIASPTMASYQLAPGFYPQYGMHLNIGMNNQMFHPQAQFGAYTTFPPQPQSRIGDMNQSRAVPQRRNTEGEANRFANVQIESLRGEIYALCKDQHGCRYLQKRLEERDPNHVQMIFLETNQHVVELMTDPFGNYLCQKLLEFSNDEQRTVLVNNAAPQLVKIALNQHGTRALQKMIEFISTPEQIQTIIHSLQDKVVALIQDLNGNHVIQKCLNRLSAEDAQAIRVAEASTKRQMIEEMLNPHELEKMLRDSYANYVVQTAMDWADSDTRQSLIDNIRPLLPAIRTTPYGRRIQSKIQVAEGRSANSSGLNTPNDVTSPGQTSLRQLPSSSYHQRQFSASQLASSLMNGTYGTGGFNNGSASGMSVNITPTTGPGPVNQAHRLSNPPFPTPTVSQVPQQSSTVQQPFPSPFGLGDQAGGSANFI